MIMKKKASQLAKFGTIVHKKNGIIPLKCLLKKFRETGWLDRRHGSGQPRIVSMEENMDLIKDLVCSQEERPHTHLAPRKIAEQKGISWSSIQGKVKKRNLTQSQHLKTPQMSEGTWNRRETCAGSLRERFESNISLIQKTV